MEGESLPWRHQETKASMRVLQINDEKEYLSVLTALNFYGNHCVDVVSYMSQKGMTKPDGSEFSKEDRAKVRRRGDQCFEMQKRLLETDHE